MPWIAQTDFEKEIVNLQPDHDFIFGDLTAEAEAKESTQQQIYHPRPEAHIKYATRRQRHKQQLQQKEHSEHCYENGSKAAPATNGNREAVSKKYSAAKMHVISEVQRIAGTKPLGEQPCLDDWDNDDNIERETIALIRHCGMGPSVEQSLDPRVTIPTVVPKKNRFTTNANGRCKVPMIFDENTLRPRNAEVSVVKPRLANSSNDFNSYIDAIELGNNETPLSSCNASIDSAEFYSTEDNNAPPSMTQYEKFKNYSSSSSSTFMKKNKLSQENDNDAASNTSTSSSLSSFLSADTPPFVPRRQGTVNHGHGQQIKPTAQAFIPKQKFEAGTQTEFMKALDNMTKLSLNETANSSVSSYSTASELSAAALPFEPKHQNKLNSNAKLSYSAILTNSTVASASSAAARASATSSLSAYVKPFVPRSKKNTTNFSSPSSSTSSTPSSSGSNTSFTSFSSYNTSSSSRLSSAAPVFIPNQKKLPTLVGNSTTHHHLYQSQKKHFIMQRMASLKK